MCEGHGYSIKCDGVSCSSGLNASGGTNVAVKGYGMLTSAYDEIDTLVLNPNMKHGVVDYTSAFNVSHVELATPFDIRFVSPPLTPSKFINMLYGKSKAGREFMMCYSMGTSDCTYQLL